MGYFNHRYFLNFLFYLTVALFILSILYIPLIFFKDFAEYKISRTGVFTITSTLSFVMLFVLIAFAGWNWFLAVTGLTTIEFWG